MSLFAPRSVFFSALILALVSAAWADDSSGKRSQKGNRPLKITVVPWGPTKADVDSAKQRTENSPAVQAALRGVKYRFISLEYIDPPAGVRTPPTRFRVTYYDYTNNRAVIADGDFAGKESIAVRAAIYQPGVGEGELKAAYALIAADSEFSASFRSKEAEIAPAMPPYSVVNGDRYVNVSVKNTATGEFKVVGVGFRNDTVLRYEGNAPPTSRAAMDTCGIARAFQDTTANGTAGQVQLTVSDNSGPLWEMLVIRPSASSGNANERSGIELRDVKYKGKSVLKRAHVPVLNVQYADNYCGPYRDWQYQEGMFDAPDAGATDPAPGIRVLAAGQVATTALESGSDVGNFRGVAIYSQATRFGQEVVLVSEMEAGWYRYIMEWRFAANGTIRPRYGFGATSNTCVCAVHSHHAFWRFDFDVVNTNNKVFQVERGGKFMSPILNETRIARSYQKNRQIVVQNGSGNEAVSLTPNLTDGVSDAFSKGDFWILKFNGTSGAPDEIDDPNTDESVNLDPWVDNESVENQDVVVWYSGHYTHDSNANPLSPDRSPEVLTGDHVVGPDIRLIRW